MFRLAALFLFAGVAMAATLEKEVPIVSQVMDMDPEGKFHWSYESGDGSKANQEGEIKVVDKDHVVNILRGAFSYVGGDGKTYTVTYTADETGFHAQGEHIPQMPDAIAKSVEYVRAHPYKGAKLL